MKNIEKVLIALAIIFVGACETTAPPENGGSEAGETVTEMDMGGAVDAGAEAGEMVAGTDAGNMVAGTDAGDMVAGEASAGFAIISAGDEMVEMRPTPMIDPTAPLPEPMVTSLEPPMEIAAAGEGEVDGDCSGTYVNEARGWVVNEVGEPLYGARVQMCSRHAETGILACSSPTETSSTGYFSIKVSASARCMANAVLRSLVARVAFAPIYCHAELNDSIDDGVLRMTDPLVLYETRPATEITEPMDEGGLAEVSLLGDVKISFNPDFLYGPTLDEVGGRSLLPTDPGLCFLEETENQVDGIFAFAPEGDLTGGTAGLSFPNTMGYEPGTEIQIYVLGNLDCSIEGQVEPIEEGEWQAYTTAMVDEAGMLINTNPDLGLPCLSWFGYGPLP